MDDARRIAVKGTVFSTWIVLGLFLDGWAHNTGRPESFWTPWHGLLYSGFLAATVTFALDRRRRRREGSPLPTDPLMLAGFALFAFAGVGDAVWHGIFGVEEDVAALLSPTHLALMIGGILLIGGPLRTRHHDVSAGRVGWRAALPDVVAITLVLAVVAFFVQFLSPFRGIEPDAYGVAGTELGHLHGVASVLVTNALFLSAVTYALRRPELLPAGTFTVLLGVPALLLSSLLAFEGVLLVGAAVVAGGIADVLDRRGADTRTLLLAVPAVLWPAWFAIHHVRWGLGWPVEYWTGVTVLAVLTGWGLDLVSRPATAGTAPVPAHVRPEVEEQVHPRGRGAPVPAAGGS